MYGNKNSVAGIEGSKVMTEGKPQFITVPLAKQDAKDSIEDKESHLFCLVRQILVLDGLKLIIVLLVLHPNLV